MELEQRRHALELLMQAMDLHTIKRIDGQVVPAAIDHKPYELNHEQGDFSCPVCAALLAVRQAYDLLFAEELAAGPPSP